MKILPMWTKITTNLLFPRNEEKTNVLGLGGFFVCFFDLELEKALFTLFLQLPFSNSLLKQSGESDCLIFYDKLQIST